MARDGAEALETLRSPSNDRPDVILLVLNLPRKDSWEVLAEIKADEDKGLQTGTYYYSARSAGTAAEGGHVGQET